ncbi:hypothetical protein Mpet_2316 [Methanolacinia petrolearia DSM 11571]|uniref:Uncharacterized protein n=1 Tax=Methanolacinia petrolearia (strain DSM 11571 / OCM 486 / SEBR 4847) TaxID=679926 RepID=E1RD80_METP4|nr:hypothetical protein [Methanolacinia petrolearia]ADN37063.1 hypothetical protein Mpet_2316 [Methanolacinia petrolearia DSM 11571]
MSLFSGLLSLGNSIVSGATKTVSSTASTTSKAVSSGVSSASRAASSGLSSASKAVSSGLSSASRAASSGLSSASRAVSSGLSAIEKQTVNVLPKVSLPAVSLPKVSSLPNVSLPTVAIPAAVAAGTVAAVASGSLPKISLPEIDLSGAANAFNSVSSYLGGSDSSVKSTDWFNLNYGNPDVQFTDPKTGESLGYLGQFASPYAVEDNYLWFNTGKGNTQVPAGFSSWTDTPDAGILTSYGLSGNVIYSSQVLNAGERADTLSTYSDHGWLTKKKLGTVPAGAGVSVQNNEGDIFGGALSAISGGIDSIIGARDRSYDDSITRITSGDAGTGGVQFAGTAAADVLLPMDLVNVSNKLLTGRGKDLDTWDYVGAGIDVGTIALGVFTGGLGYGASRALIKGGKAVTTGGEMFKITKLFGAADAAETGAKVISNTGTGLKGFSNTPEITGIAVKLPNVGTDSRITDLAVREADVLGGWTKGGSGATSFYTKTAEPTYKIFSSAAEPTFKVSSVGETFVKTASPVIETGAKGTDAAFSSAVKAPSSGLLGKAAGGAGLLGLGGLTAMALFGSGSSLQGGGTPDQGDVSEYVAYIKQLEDQLTNLQAQYEAGAMSDAEYIAALEQYVAELEAALQSGQITQDQYDSLYGDAYDEYLGATGGYYDPAFGDGTYYEVVEDAAQDATRLADGIPILSDVLQWFRSHGLALPGLIVVGGVVVIGGAYAYSQATGKRVKLPALPAFGKTTRKSGGSTGRRRGTGRKSPASA